MLLRRSIRTLEVLKMTIDSALVKLLAERAANIFRYAIGANLTQKLQLFSIAFLTMVSEDLVPINSK